MATQTTRFAGLRLRNPVVAASSPATETVERIMRCADAGAAAVITKSISSTNTTPLSSGCRRMFLGTRGIWGTSTFARETLPLDAGCALIAGAKARVEIPVIASVAATDLRPESWMPTCVAVCQAGAQAIHLDFFYCQDIQSSVHTNTARALAVALASALPVPVFPKLNVDIPARRAIEVFSDTGVAGISLLDSVTVPPPIRLDIPLAPGFQFTERPTAASLFGSWQLPLALHYTDALAAATNWDILAGGGITAADDAIHLLLAGAAAVQVASAVLVKGFAFIASLVSDIELFLNMRGFADLDHMRREARGIVARSDLPTSPPAYAKIQDDHCQCCGRCAALAFCDAISSSAPIPAITPGRCDGCGACAAFCPHGAISLRPAPLHSVV